MLELLTPEKEKQDLKFAESPKFSAIVPIYNITRDILKRCLESLKNQKYSPFEVVMVLDGPNPELKGICEDYAKENAQWSVFEIEHKGACAARNFGFSKSTGEIVAFINSDYVMKRGIIQLWVDSLQENPDCGFLYGGYEYTSSHRWYYPSKPFDPFLLQVANYIDCGFPLWRKYVVPWDENCKSLQDWDFWLRVIKTHGVKGYFLEREISFAAEPPRAKGLSMDSSSNWIDRVKYIKEKNGIPLRDLVVTSIGASNHGIEIAKMLKADYRDDTILKPNEYKAVYMIGFYMKPDQMTNEHGPILASFGKDVKKIVHYVGADLFWLRKFSYENLKALSGAFQESKFEILVENEAAKDELKDLLGITAKIVPIPPYQEIDIKPLPKDFTVSIFLTDKSDFDKYLKEHTLSIVRAMPDVNFTAYGDAAKDIHYPNLKCFGSIERSKWSQYVYDNSCYLRICRHDTVPMASAEFMLAGRFVVSNIKGECTHWIDTSGESKINSWDQFAPGFNPSRWSKTKKKIIQTIRSLDEVAIHPLKERFNREKYIQTIYDLAGL